MVLEGSEPIIYTPIQDALGHPPPSRATETRTAIPASSTLVYKPSSVRRENHYDFLAVASELAIILVLTRAVSSVVERLVYTQ